MIGEREARVVWAMLAEPGDAAAALVIEALGHVEALAWMEHAAARPAAAVAELAGAPAAARALVARVGRWAPRVDAADPARLVRSGERLGARILIPLDHEWPAALADLGAAAPHALWVRGSARLDQVWDRSLAVVGARAATAYGEHVAGEIASAAAERGVGVLSGGAYGIDAAAHRGALAVGGPTVAVLAGGVDQLYPAGNADLLGRVMASGAVVSEQPPGFAPHRSRFLTRNRLIATAGATVVVEAALRSGALNTAAHAAELLRPVGAVPGPLTSAASAGCHSLVASHRATLVMSAADAVDLALPLDRQEAVDCAVGEDRGGAATGGAEAGERVDFRATEERQAYGAIGSRGSTADAVAVRAGLSAGEVLGALGALEARGLVSRRDGTWRRIVRHKRDKP